MSLGEQQMLGVARLLLAAPRFAFLDRPHTALSPEQLEKALQIGQSYSFAAAPSLPANVVLTGLGGSDGYAVAAEREAEVVIAVARQRRGAIVDGALDGDSGDRQRPR